MKSPAARIFLRAFTLGWIFGGMSYFYLLAEFDYNPFSLDNSDYYFWDKTSMVLVLLCLLFPFRRMKNQFYVLLSFCIVRAGYELPYLRNYIHLDKDIMFVIWCVHVGVLILVTWLGGVMENNRTYIAKMDAYYSELYKNAEDETTKNVSTFQ